MISSGIIDASFWFNFTANQGWFWCQKSDKEAENCTIRGKSTPKDKDMNDDVNDEKDMNEDVSYTEANSSKI